MNTVTLNAKIRKERGKEDAKKVKNGGRIPAVVYGEGKPGVSITVEPRELNRLYRGPLSRNTIIKLAVDSEGVNEDFYVISHEFSRHPVSRDIIHVDFMRVYPDKPVSITVGFEFSGVAPGVKKGGNLTKKMSRVKISCLPDQIPVSFPVDISLLEVGESITVGDLALGEGVSMLSPLRDVVVLVSGSRKSEEAETVAPVAVVSGKK